jgi:hypothetical protein
MVRKLFLFIILGTLFTPLALAQSGGTRDIPESNAPAAADPVGTVESASMKGRCALIDQKEGQWAVYPPCANTPAECGSSGDFAREPINCLFLTEPLGGDPGYDLYKITCAPSDSQMKGDGTICTYSLWYGEALVGNEVGPVQAVLTYEPGKEHQGPFGLLYNYLALVYNFLSGIIIGFVILIAIVGGIMMTTSAGNQEKFNRGRDMIIKALIGMVLWFTASVILYTINPTFFAF